MNHYEVLGVSQKATTEEIKTVYRRLVKRYHPDRNPQDKQAEKQFILISNAYETLKSEALRKKYDRRLKEANPSTSKKSTVKDAAGVIKNEYGSKSQNFESFFGFTQTGKPLKKQTKKTTSVNQSDWLESFLRPRDRGGN